MLSGKKTYILVALALIGATVQYATGVINNGFNVGDLLNFLQSQAVVAALATIRLAIAKK